MQVGMVRRGDETELVGVVWAVIRKLYGAPKIRIGVGIIFWIHSVWVVGKGKWVTLPSPGTQIL